MNCRFVEDCHPWPPRGSRFEQCHFDGADLTGSNLNQCHFTDCTFSHSILRSISGEQSHVQRCIFIDCSLQGARFNHSNLTSCKFSGLTSLEGAQFQHCTFEDVSFDDIDRTQSLRTCDFSRTTLGALNLSACDLRSSSFSGASALSANLREARLQGANLSDAKLDGADLRGVTVDHQTRLDGAEVAATRIDHFALQALSNFGGLTRGQMMQMRIDNGLADLRAAYSGFWQWLHIAALIIFLFPYAVETGRAYIASRAGCTAGPCETILAHMAAFIYTGGRPGHGLAITSFGPFVYGLLYNLLRGVLLGKTKSLELRQEASGLPVSFGLERRVFAHLKLTWGMLLGAASIGFWINVVLVLLHTYHFLSRSVPMH